MKSLTILFFIGIICLVRAADVTKKELEERANKLEKLLKEKIKELDLKHPHESGRLAFLDGELRLLILDIQQPHTQIVLNLLMDRINALEAEVQEIFNKLNSTTSTPTKPTTLKPTYSTTTKPKPTTTPEPTLLTTTQGPSTYSVLTSTSPLPIDCINFNDIFINSAGIQQKTKYKIQELTKSNKITEASKLLDQEKELEKFSDELHDYFAEVQRVIKNIKEIENNLSKNIN